MSFRSLSRAFLLSTALSLSCSLLSTSAQAEDASGISLLKSQLASGDFRMQVQAALILGKTGDGRALPALIDGLADKSVAVRAASAAALSTLGDPAALPALRRCLQDDNKAVKRRVELAVASLEKLQREQLVSRRSAKILVKMEGFESRLEGNVVSALGVAAQESRKLLESMPQVAVLNASEDPQTAAARHKRPVIFLRASLRKLASAQDGSDTIVSADIEFVVQAFPAHNIVGSMSGNASAKSVADSSKARAQLQEDAVGAAVASALRRSEAALIAAAERG